MLTIPPLPGAIIVPLNSRGEVFVRIGEPKYQSRLLPVLCVHGWGLSADLQFFTSYDTILSQGHVVIAPDLRGHGRSLRSPEAFSLYDCADDLVSLLDELKIEKAILYGYSMGAIISLIACQRYRDRVGGLILGAAAGTVNRFGAKKLVRPLAFALDHVLRSETRTDIFLRRFLNHVVAADPELNIYSDWYRCEARRGNVRALTEAGKELVNLDMRPLVHDVASHWPKTASVVSMRDHAVPPSRQLKLAYSLGAQVFEVKGDHDMIITARNEYCRALTKGLAYVGALGNDT